MDKDDTNNPGYKVEKVEQITPPEGMEDKIWHRYVIGRGNSRIEGKAPGSLEEVTQHAETLAEGFNLRRGKGGSTYTTRKRV